MSLTTPLSVQKLQTALHDKAKGSPKFRFYALYDKVYREDVMAVAYECCKANRGAAGVDGQTFEDIEEYGVKKWLDELTQELKSRTYRPQPVRRVWIPKPDGKQRPLGVPAIKDRVAQTATVLVLEPIFEADLPPEQYAYRENRSALDAVRHVHKLLNTGHGQIVDADLSGYFDSIPHADLLKSVARRIVDGAMLHLIKMWLEVPVEETDEKGNKHRSMRNRDEGRGTPQGASISPLLSNLYMRRFVLGWKKLGHEKRLSAYIVNYADDLVICCRGRAEEALAGMRDIKKCSRRQLLVFTANLEVELIGMESCSGSHFFGRALREQGHEVRLMPAQYVKPCVQTNKSDFLDAEAIAEAVQRPRMRFVSSKVECKPFVLSTILLILMWSLIQRSRSTPHATCQARTPS